jgi:isopenicillin N synthase-like dioxygenase
MSAGSIPVIDIERLMSRETLEELDVACLEWGFFQVIHHGIPQDAIETIFSAAREFFARPSDVKRQIVRTPTNPWGFYDRELTRNVRDLKEIYDFGADHTSFLRLNFYPVDGSARHAGQLGVGQHTDAGALTILEQYRISA